jgi:hypothetical protein
MTAISPPALLFGPWVPDISETERVAGFRALAALTAVFAGSGHVAVGALRRAESDASLSGAAQAAFDGLPALPRRKIISVYAAVMYPRRVR